jgi:hypothetical protein
VHCEVVGSVQVIGEDVQKFTAVQAWHWPVAVRK